MTLNVAHRSIFERGNEQKIAISHCFSCHATSQEAVVDRSTHSIRAGLGAEIKDVGVEYLLNYRRFESSAEPATAPYDTARHPVNGTAGAEFGSRVIYEGEVLDFGVYPETETFSHTGKVRAKVGKGRINGSVGYIETENKRSDLKTKAVNGNLGYAVPLTDRYRLIARLYGIRRIADNVRIDLPTWRESRPDSNPVNFDWYRYSSLSRIEGRGTLELVTKLTRKTTLSVLGGYSFVDRVDYPTPDTRYTTKKFIAQARARYRDGKKFNGSIKYRYENTTDPLRSDRGLLEARGREILKPTSPNWAFYYQREDLRFLNVTSLPTDYHEVHLKGGMRATDCINVNAGLKTVFDKNNDLDTLDVQHFMIQPNVNMVMTPCKEVALNVGYTYDYSRSRGPITVPIFDG